MKKTFKNEYKAHNFFFVCFGSEKNPQFFNICIKYTIIPDGSLSEVEQGIAKKRKQMEPILRYMT